MTDVEPAVQRVIDAIGLRPNRITFLNVDKPMFTLDEPKPGVYRVIYSEGFVRMLARLQGPQAGASPGRESQ
jgi:hypothetical protein